ncbi:MAG: TonB-dependent receptor domain-containing protein [Fidelibacterota bacterium]
MRKILMVTLVGMAFLSTAKAQGTVTGTVTDAQGSPVLGANVFLEGTFLGSASGTDGTYVIGRVPAGDYVVVARAVGYRTVRVPVSLSEGQQVIRNFSLVEDVIGLDEVVTTATRSPLSMIESSTAVTTLSEEDIRRYDPRSTADLLTRIPGFYVESSGGQVGNNLFARGLPADGSYRYVALMEDGMPVYDETELYFVNADILIRVDDNIERVEAARGGNSALFGHNNPGGVINFISKSGGSQTATSLKVTAGTDGFYRTDFNMNGPLGNIWRYNLGGFYRFDEGLRITGMPVSSGGQIKGNITRLFPNGYVRIQARHLNDSNTFYLGLPVMGEVHGGKYVLTDEFVEGFPRNGSMSTEEANLTRIPTPDGHFTMPLEDGQKQVGSWVLADVNFAIPGQWKVRNKVRWMNVDHSWNAIVPFSIIEASKADNATYAGTITAVSEAYVASSGLWHVAVPLANFSNQFQLQRRFEFRNMTHGVTLGHYFGRHTHGSFWFWQDIMTTVPDSTAEFTRLVDVTGSQNGFTRYGSMYLNAHGRVTTQALYFGDDIRVSDRVRVNLGLRFEGNDLRNYSENEATYDLGDPTTTADDNVLWGDGTFRQAEAHFNNLAYSLGVNYMLSDSLSLYGRVSRGYKTPMASEIMWSEGDVTSGENPLESEDLFEREGGIKMSSGGFGANVTIFSLTLSNFPSSDARIDPETGETVFVIDYVGEARTVGIEGELVAMRGPLKIDGAFTFQDHRYTNFVDPGAGNRDFSGNWVKRIPQLMLNSGVRYGIGGMTVGGRWIYTGLRYANTANDIELPGFGVVDLYFSYRISESMVARVDVKNALNGNGLTEGNPRTDETGAYESGPVLARPILPRRIQAGLRFEF